MSSPPTPATSAPAAAAAITPARSGGPTMAPAAAFAPVPSASGSSAHPIPSATRELSSSSSSKNNLADATDDAPPLPAPRPEPPSRPSNRQARTLRDPACTACRSLKKKCPGGTPCAPCGRAGRACVYKCGVPARSRRPTTTTTTTSRKGASGVVLRGGVGRGGLASIASSLTSTTMMGRTAVGDGKPNGNSGSSGGISSRSHRGPFEATSTIAAGGDDDDDDGIVDDLELPGLCQAPTAALAVRQQEAVGKTCLPMKVESTMSEEDDDDDDDDDDLEYAELEEEDEDEYGIERPVTSRGGGSHDPSSLLDPSLAAASAASTSAGGAGGAVVVGRRLSTTHATLGGASLTSTSPLQQQTGHFSPLLGGGGGVSYHRSSSSSAGGSSYGSSYTLPSPLSLGGYACLPPVPLGSGGGSHPSSGPPTTYAHHPYLPPLSTPYGSFESSSRGGSYSTYGQHEHLTQMIPAAGYIYQPSPSNVRSD